MRPHRAANRTGVPSAISPYSHVLPPRTRTPSTAADTAKFPPVAVLQAPEEQVPVGVEEAPGAVRISSCVAGLDRTRLSQRAPLAPSHRLVDARHDVTNPLSEVQTPGSQAFVKSVLCSTESGSVLSPVCQPDSGGRMGPPWEIASQMSPVVVVRCRQR